MEANIYINLKDLVTEVNQDIWLVDSLLLRRSKGASPLSTWYDQQEDFSYFVTDAPTSRPPSVPLRDKHLTFRLAFCKIKPYFPNTTPEAVTLDFVHAHKPTLEIPKVLHNTIHDGKCYLFTTRVPGRTLAEAWPSLDKTWKHLYVESVAGICESLQLIEGEKLGDVDGNGSTQNYLFGCNEEKTSDSQVQLEKCRALGMDCSKFIFCHLDLGPVNIMVEEVPESGRIGIIDWENAGFFPRVWLRTNVNASVGLNIPEEFAGSDDRTWWRYQLQTSLEKEDFQTVQTNGF
ncbi:hypothetical protein N7540_008515 [Penicillium herquei]|nr:hypothetical protein N7540_008515 [Penicillium herquei]